MEQSNFFAVDLGATSGRTILGSIVNGKLSQRELSRFNNPIIETGGHYFWDIFHLYNEIIKGLKICGDENISLDSIGIDTWGVDFLCFGKDQLPLRNPYCYRDPYTNDIMDRFFEKMSKETVYAKTGIQFMNFNSLFQLYAQKLQEDEALAYADKILFIPDALAYMLTGNATCEYTILSTSQMLNPKTKKIDNEILDILGLKESQFGRYVQPGEKVGELTTQIQKITHLGAIPVIAVAGHDTGSAVAAVPSKDEHFAYLSCGTWSLLGIEVKDAIISEKSIKYNFTNEGGIENTTRFLKNICGMWIFERCRSEWVDAPKDINTIINEAMKAEPFKCFINPDDSIFANPESMVKAINDYMLRTGQYVPQDYREMSRCIFESLAMRYHQVLDYLREMSPVPISRLHVIGGGALNQHFMQMTADSIGIPVITGPIEGTAIGNIMIQAKAKGLVGDRFEMRQIIAQSISLTEYLPKSDWIEAYQKYLSVTSTNE